MISGPFKFKSIRRRIRSAHRRFREAKVFVKALRSPRHPILAHLVPIRRCNLSCSYCNEYDKSSPPVPTAEMVRRVDLLAALGASIIHLSGGEPLLHPEIDQIIRRIRSHGILAGVLTNGYLLGPKHIEALNRTGLDHLQISIDNISPNDVSQKSLDVVERKLEHLARYAEFEVNVNSVLGNEMETPEDTLLIARKAVDLGFTSTLGIIHDQDGQLRPLDGRHREIYEEVSSLGKRIFSAAGYTAFQKNMANGLPNDWHCHAGSRYLYVCEDGFVHYCSQQRGSPGIPLDKYTREHLAREYQTVKHCAPYCTVSCVHRVAWLDSLRENPREALEEFFPARHGEWSSSDLPTSVRVLNWMFLPNGPNRKPGMFARASLWILGE